MSKRDAGSSVGSYIEDGFLPQAVVNYLSLLGWTPKLEGEKFSLQDASPVFEVADIHHHNAKFDMTKCVWMNQQHLRDLTGDALVEHARPWLKAAKLVIDDSDYAAKALESVKEKVSLASEFPGWVHFFFREDFQIEDEAMAKLKANAQAATLLSALGGALSHATRLERRRHHRGHQRRGRRAEGEAGRADALAALLPQRSDARTGREVDDGSAGKRARADTAATGGGHALKGS